MSHEKHLGGKSDFDQNSELSESDLDQVTGGAGTMPVPSGELRSGLPTGKINNPPQAKGKIKPIREDSPEEELTEEELDVIAGGANIPFEDFSAEE
jgi:hypothetical protein